MSNLDTFPYKKKALMERRKSDTSESDDDANVRHDRFASERFKDSSLDTNIRGSMKSSKYPRDKHINERHRERSPRRDRYEKTETSHRKESRIKYNETSYSSKSNKVEKHCLRDHLPSQTLRKPSEEQNKDINDFDPSKNSSKKLSSILVNFDKKTESKRLNSLSFPQIGPSLPPHLIQKSEKEEEGPVDPNIDTPVGPALPPHLKCHIKSTTKEPAIVIASNQSYKILENEIESADSSKNIDHRVDKDFSFSMGPELPPHLKNQTTQNVVSSEKELISAIVEETKISSPSENENFLCGPALPSKLEEDSYGPVLPPDFEKRSMKGPVLPSGITSDDLLRMEEEESEDEDTFGPLPVGKMNMTQYQLELRAMDIKRKLEEEKSGSSKDIKKREEWMLELPPEKASNLGLGPRSFRMKEGPDMSNRSAWTDTPAEKKRKEEMALRGEAEPVNSEEVMRSAFVKERNETMDKISKHSREEDRQKSLLEIHQKKLKKKKKKEEKDGKKKERRPFDRNIDLQVHRFDEAQKKAIFKKAQLLDTRFSSGESKYL